MLLAAALFCLLAAPASAHAAFGIASLSTAATNEDGTPDFQAGSHPFAYSFSFAMNADAEGRPEGGLRSIVVDLPPGLVGDPGAVRACSRQEFNGTPRCPSSAQVGVVEAAVIGLGVVRLPLYDLLPPPGYVASFGGAAAGNSFVELVSVAGSGPESHLTVTVPLLPMGGDLVRVTQTLWGVPADPGHDAERGECLSRGGACPATIAPAALLTLPVSCDGPLTTTVSVASLADPGRTLTTGAQLLDPAGSPQRLLGCDAQPFAPTLALGAGGAALSPSGLALDLGLPAGEAPYGRAAAAPRELDFRLPAGLALNPGAAAGLVGCSAAQIGLRSEPGQAARFDLSAPACPEASRIGAITAELPALGETLSGSVYLAEPGRNPYGSTFAMYLVLEDPARGLEIKIPGSLEADPATGRLTATITDLPEFPFAGLSIRFPSGPRALFATPPGCGTYLATGDLVPSTAPEGPAAQVRATFALGSGPGGPCPAPESLRPVAGSFAAGSTLPLAGASSPFVLRFARADLDQHFGSFELTLPPGLVADLGATPVGTTIGTVRVQAGLGAEPLALAGTVRLGGPYAGAPYSLEFVLPGEAGPFDLGTIVVRAAVSVDPVSAQVTLRSDPLPQILGGVPLELRSLAVDLDRRGFVRNPTSCEPTAITGSATSSLGQAAPLSARFQVAACAALAFRPKLSLRFSGALGRNGHPALRVVLRTDPEGAALKSARFSLPASELLDLRHVRRLCSRGVAVGECPPASRLGWLRLHSPALGAPIEGAVYLRAPRHRLPGLSAEVRSGALRFLLHGRTTLAKGRLGVALESLPDIPLSRAVLTLAGGRRGILVNSRSLCRGIGAVTARLAAHDGRQRRLRVRPRRPAGCSAASKRRRHSKIHG